MPPIQCKHDIAIVGGGLAGLTLGLLLAQHGLDISIIERATLAKQTQRSFDTRTTALAAGTVRLLTAIGIWPHLQEKACPIEHIEILDGPHLIGQWPVRLDFSNTHVNGQPFGYIVDNYDLRVALADCAYNQENFTLYTPCDWKNIDVQDDQVMIDLETGDQLSAKLLIAADGRGSSVRDHFRIRTRGWPYDHTAVVSTITHTGDHQNIAIEHFLKDGPFAALPFTPDTTGQPRSAIVWSARPQQAREIMAMSDETFRMALSTRLPDRYGDITANSSRGAYPLTLQHAENYIAPRCALVGDAAHGIHPIAGQGLNLGMRDIADLADLIILDHQTGAKDPGQMDLLQKYQTKRRTDVMAMVGATDILTELFGMTLPGIPLIRKAGLHAVQKIPALKKFFINQAMGGTLVNAPYAWDQQQNATNGF